MECNLFPALSKGCQLNQSIFDQDAAEVDKYFGFQVEEIEKKLLKAATALRPEGNHKTWGEAIHQGNQSWVGLDPQTLLTPYVELKLMCELLRPRAQDRIVDLGAGYGRLGLVLKAYYPEVYFLGLELVYERVREGSRILQENACERAKLLTQDLMDPAFMLPLADYYFIYDYGKVSHIRHTLDQLSVIAAIKNFKVVGRGLGTRSLIENEYPWLSDVYPVVREKNFSIYSMSG